MKIPCELVVWYLLSTIRKEVARELVDVYGYTQAKVAETFGVTDAAISQYLKNKRGSNQLVTGNPEFPKVLDAIKESTARIVKENAEFTDEVCNICMVAKSVGILSKIYEVEFNCSPPPCSCSHSIKFE